MTGHPSGRGINTIGKHGILNLGIPVIDTTVDGTARATLPGQILPIRARTMLKTADGVVKVLGPRCTSSHKAGCISHQRMAVQLTVVVVSRDIVLTKHRQNPR
eukprot:Lithocolla_globosa_v1_NODE_7_length_11908_cov_272.203830.p9 type:complete len:103 gc:universal NODE_7_length_11908_cov_272.203830:9781-9473(-)